MIFVVLGLALLTFSLGYWDWLRARKKFFDACDRYKSLTGQKHRLDFRKEEQWKK